MSEIEIVILRNQYALMSAVALLLVDEVEGVIPDIVHNLLDAGMQETKEILQNEVSDESSGS